MKGRAFGVGMLLTALALLQVGCLDRKLRPVTPCVSQGFVQSIEQEGVDKVDLLFMVDNSMSMQQEQTSLASNFPRMVKALVTGDRLLNNPTDGTEPTPEQAADDFPAVKDLHVGVITSDMGTAGVSINTCALQPHGEDGLLRDHAGAGAASGCPATNLPFLSFIPNANGNDTATNKTPEQFASDFACVAQVGTNGCGFEQQLEATLKAVTPASSLITFQDNTRGNGTSTRNNGFIREDSVIALVVVTDEEDCSFQDRALVDGSRQDVRDTNINLRCVNFPSLLYSVDRYVNGFKALRPTNPNLVVFAAITGIPVDLVPQNGTPGEYQTLLDDPRMQQQVDPGNPNQLKPSCNDPDRGKADPPRRIVELARDFGQNSTVQSICQADFSPALDAIIAKIADALGNVCLPRKLNPNASGQVGCDVVEELPLPDSAQARDGAPTRCQDIPGCTNMNDLTNCPVEITPIRTVDGREYCRVKQLTVTRSSGGVVAPTGAGWYYDDFSDETLDRCTAYETAQRIAFTDRARPARGVVVSLECLQRVQSPGTTNTLDTTQTCNSDSNCPSNAVCTKNTPSDATGICERVDIGSFCDPEENTGASGTVPSHPKCMRGTVTISGSGQSLFCDSISRTCQLDCQNDSDCPASFVCDDRNRSDAAPYGVCVNPICL